MIGLLLAVAWLVVAFAVLRGGVVPAATGRPARHFAGPIETLGRAARGLGGRAPSPDADRRAGIGIAVAGCLLVDPVLGAAATIAVAARARWRSSRSRAAGTRQQAMAVPELADLLVVTTEAGLTVPASLPVLARSAPPELRPALDRAHMQFRGGARVGPVMSEALASLGPGAAGLRHVIDDHLRYGTPLLAPLERVAAEARADRRRALERRARRLPVLLLFPLVLCTLPAFGLLTVGPVLVGTLQSLDGSGRSPPAARPVTPPGAAGSPHTPDARNDLCPEPSPPSTAPSCPSPTPSAPG